MIRSLNRRKRFVLAGLIAVTTLTAIGASAASLGALTIPSLGASDAPVLTCTASGATVTYNYAYDATNGTYSVASLNIAGLPAACNGLTLRVAVKTGGTASESSPTTVVNGTMLVNIVPTAVAKNITVVSLIVTG
jgi:hypothetical protein